MSTKGYNSFELYYDTGGHGGPHGDLLMAIAYAKQLLAGSETLTAVEIRPRHANMPMGGFDRKNAPRSIIVEREEQ